MGIHTESSHCWVFNFFVTVAFVFFILGVSSCVLVQLRYLNCSDRKAIISHGRLKCVGSSFFLKTHFGIGYQLSYVCCCSSLCVVYNSVAFIVSILVPSVL